MAATSSLRVRRRVALAVLAASSLALLGGCVVAPAGSYEVGAPVVYSGSTAYGSYGYPYGGTTVYHYGSPYGYATPPVSLGFHGYWRDRDRGRRGHGWQGHRPPSHWDRPGRPPRGHGPAGSPASRAMPELSGRELPPPRRR